jgi:hypothetical protein
MAKNIRGHNYRSPIFQFQEDRKRLLSRPGEGSVSKTAEEMDLTPPGLIHRLTRLRDYKPYALQMLQQAGIVQKTEDGRFYMPEEKLNEDMKCRVVWQQI